MAAFFARRLVLAASVVVAVSFGTFALMATEFSSTCTSSYTPIGVIAPPLAANVAEAASLYWDWLQGVPSGRSFGAICGGEATQQMWPAFAHTGALLGATAVLVIVISLLFGTLAATRAGSAPDAILRSFSYTAWAVPPFVLALMLQAGLRWAESAHGFHWFGISGWPASCLVPPGTFVPCGPTGGAAHHAVEIVRHLIVPTGVLAVAFVGVHSRYLRSSLITALNAPYTTTARAKGVPERAVVLRHALRNSLATFTSALLLDFGAVFGAAMAVDWVFQLNGLGSLLLMQVGGIGSGDAPRYLNPYAIETLLATASGLVVVSSLLAEVAVAWLDPRAR